MRDPRIADRDALIADRDRWIADRDGWIAERDAHIAACETALVVSREERAAIERSLSFRIGRALTAPVRWLRDRFASKSRAA